MRSPRALSIYTYDMTTAVPTANFAHPGKNVSSWGIAPGMTVADFGSGSGHYSLEIAERLKNEGHLYAVDVQQDLLRRLKNEAHKRGYKNVEVIWGDLEAERGSKLADGHIDLVLISNLLFQLEIKEAAFREAVRILRPKGRCIVIDWSESSGGLGPQKKAVVKKETARSLAESAGLEFLEEFPAGAHHYGLVFAKRA